MLQPMLDSDRAAPTGIARAHQRILAKIFQHPLTHGLTWRDLTLLLAAIGSAETRPNGILTLRLSDKQLSLKPARGKDLSSAELFDVRHLLVRAGWSGSGAASVPAALADGPDTLVVIDHAGARLYTVQAERDAMAAAASDPSPLVQIERHHHATDRREIYPADARFFDAVADALPTKGRIVLVSDGTGRGCEGAHLGACLAQHYRLMGARIVGHLTADVSHSTVAQLVALTRTALGPAIIELAEDHRRAYPNAAAEI